MKFDYKQISEDIYRPIIPITLRSEDQEVNYEVLVDSGADISILDNDIAEVLNLDPEDGEEEKFVGVGGEELVMHVHPVTIEVGGWEYETKAGFADLPPNGYGIVGQNHFFRFFRITFDYTKKKLHIEQKDK